MSIENEYCPNCDSKSLRELQRHETLSDRQDIQYEIPNYEFTFCDNCEFEFVTAKQVKSNDILLENARRDSVNLLSTGEIRRIRKRYSLRQEDASRIFGGGPNAFSKYERGYISQSTAMDRLLRVADAFPETVTFLRSLINKNVVVPSIRSKLQSHFVPIQVDRSAKAALRAIQRSVDLRIVAVPDCFEVEKMAAPRVRRIEVSSSNDESWTPTLMVNDG